jgi:predicted enzyme related to lactoylglutathione lyase
MSNALNWFEIPAADLERAGRFYEAVTGKTLRRETFLDVPHAIFTSEGVGGAVVADPKNKPSAAGSVVYLNAGTEGDLEAWLGRVGKAGGEVLLGKTSLGPQGFFGLIRDTEGNRVGVHAPLAK